MTTRAFPMRALGLAAGLVAFSGLSALAQDATQAGVSAAVRGDVQLARADAVGRQVNSGEAIFLDDQISSGSDSGMQIMLLDETVFTIGPESEIAIDSFVYDPASESGSLAATMVRGTMKFVTGKISAGTPENMTIKLPVGTIGIRGTMGVLAVLTPQEAAQAFPDQMAQAGGGASGEVTIFAALTGPGPATQTGNSVGSFNYTTPDGSADLNRPGSAVLKIPGQEPITFQLPPGALQNFTNSLNSTDTSTEDDGESGSGDGDGQQQSSQGDGDQSDGGQSGGDGSGTGGVTSQSGTSNDASFQQVNNIVASNDTSSQNSGTISDVSSSSSISNFSFADLAALSGSLGGSGTFPGNSTNGSYNFNINLSTRDINVDIAFPDSGGSLFTGTNSMSSDVSWSSLASSGDPALFRLDATGANSNISTGYSSCSTCTADILLQDSSNYSISATNDAGTFTDSGTTSSGS